MNLQNVPAIFLVLVFIVTVAVAGYLILAGLQTAVSDGNASNNIPVESAITNFTTSFTNVISYAPTWGTIIGVAVLIGIVLAAFAYGRGKFGGGGEGAL